MKTIDREFVIKNHLSMKSAFVNIGAVLLIFFAAVFGAKVGVAGVPKPAFVVIALFIIIYAVYDMFKLFKAIKKRKGELFAEKKILREIIEKSDYQYAVFEGEKNTDRRMLPDDSFYSLPKGSEFWRITNEDGFEICCYPCGEYALKDGDFVIK